MFFTVNLYLHLNCELMLTELFEMELFFDIETVLTLNRISRIRTA